VSAALKIIGKRDGFVMEDFAELIPRELHSRSGAVFYSGRLAFQAPSRLYLLGLNPGGSPITQVEQTVWWHVNKVLYNERDNWSAYRDESWFGAAPGTWRSQPRVLHLLKGLGMDAGRVPASNLVFLRSRHENEIEGDIDEAAEKCWPVHQTVIEQLGADVILCLGYPTGNWVRRRLGADEQIDEFLENSERKWASRTYRNAGGKKVVVLTDPNIADWTAPTLDPGSLVRAALEQG